MHKIHFYDLSFQLGARYLYCHRVLSFFLSQTNLYTFLLLNKKFLTKLGMVNVGEVLEWVASAIAMKAPMLALGF